MSVAVAEPPAPPDEPAPPAWAELPPGPELAAALADAEQRGMDEFELVEAMAAYRRLSSWAQAQEMGAVLDLSTRRRRGPAAKVLTGTADCSEFVPVEIALALGLTNYSAIRVTQRAHALANRFPRVFEALEAGRLDMPKVYVILGETGHLPDALCGKVEAAIVPQAFWQTTAELRDMVKREVAIADPDTAEQRRQEAIKQRRLVRHVTDHGTSGLYLLDAPPELTAAVHQRVTACARQMKNAGDRCPMSVLRADVLTAWGLGADPNAVHECPPPKPQPAPTRQPVDQPAAEVPDEPLDGSFPPGPTVEDDLDPGSCDRPHPSDQPNQPDQPDLPDLPPPPDAPADPYDWNDGWDDPVGADGDQDVGGEPADGSESESSDYTDSGIAPAPRRPGPSGGFGAVGGINLIIPLETARGRAERPGELDGFGPILPIPARQLLNQATTDTVPWSWTVVNEQGRACYHGITDHRPDEPGAWDGLLQDVQDQLADHTDELDMRGCSATHPPPGEPNRMRYLFSSADRRLLQVRDRTCRTPGCRYPARLCDCHHTIPHHLGGPTCACNGGPECRHHHRSKQERGWRLDQPRPGHFVLTAPNGHQYVTEQDPYPT